MISNKLTGKNLHPAISIESELQDAIIREMKAMTKSVIHEFTDMPGISLDASPVSQGRIRINALKAEWETRFSRMAKKAVERMIDRIVKNSTVTLGLSLKDIASRFEIDTTLSDARLKEVIQASTEQCVNLITRIPSKYLDEVQGEVMRSITTGRGLQDLTPFMIEKYKGSTKHAKLIAIDQTRKAYTSINVARLQRLGVESFIWVHSGGGKHPRQDHINMSGKEFRFDDPPVIDRRTGERGLPSQTYNCRCTLRPVFNFEGNNAA